MTCPEMESKASNTAVTTFTRTVSMIKPLPRSHLCCIVDLLLHHPGLRGTWTAAPQVAVPSPLRRDTAHLSWNKVLRTRTGSVVLGCVAGTFHGNHGGGCPAVARSTDGGQTLANLRSCASSARAWTTPAAATSHSVKLPTAVWSCWRWPTPGTRPTTSSAGAPRMTGVKLAAGGNREAGAQTYGFGVWNILDVPGQGLSVMGHRAGSSPHTQGIWMAHSADNGQSWGSARRISEVYAVEPVFLGVGERWLARSRRWTGISRGGQFVASSDDQGQTWTTQLPQLDASDPKGRQPRRPAPWPIPTNPARS